MELILRSVLIGVGATLVMDLWAALLRRLGVPSLNFALLGRWLGHLPRGRLVHQSIARAEPVQGERWLGWAAHYGIGGVTGPEFRKVSTAGTPRGGLLTHASILTVTVGAYVNQIPALIWIFLAGFILLGVAGWFVARRYQRANQP